MVNPNTTWDMNVTGNYGSYGEDSTIRITTKPYNLTGDTLTVKIDDIVYIVPIIDGVATLRLNNLTALI